MARLLDPLSDAYLLEIARHFAALDLPYPAPQPPRLPAAAAAARAGARAAGRCARRDSGLRAMPRRRAHRRAAEHAGPARPAARLPQRAAGRVAHRPAARACARLHGADRAAARARRTSPRWPAGWRPSRCRPTRRPARVAGAAARDRLRQRIAAGREASSHEAAGGARCCSGVLAVLALVLFLNFRGQRQDPRRAAAHAADGRKRRARRLPGARGQLHGLPHRARRRAVRGRPRHRDAFRHRVRGQPDAASGHRHRRAGRASTSGARCTRAARATAGCCTRPSPIPTTRGSRAPTPTRCTTTCAAWRRWTAPTRRTGCAGPTARRPRWRCGGRCTSRPGAPRGRSHARSARMEPRRLPGARPGPLRRLPHRPQCAGREQRHDGSVGRPDPDAELVRAVAHLAGRGGRGRLGPGARSSACCGPACRRAAPCSGPMAEVVLHSTQYLAPADLRAMAVFLKSLPPSAAARPHRRLRRVARMAERGAKLYERTLRRMPWRAGPGRARRLPGAGRQSRRDAAGDSQPGPGRAVRRFRAGHRGQPAPLRHAAFATVLSDADVAAVLSHIRAAWGNRAPAVSELAVSQQRGGSSP